MIASMSHVNSRDKANVGARRLPIDSSAIVINGLKAWVAASKIATLYDLAEILDVPRSTLHRWLTHPVRLSSASLEKMLLGLSEHVQTAREAQVELERLVAAAQNALTHQDADPTEHLRTHLRSRGVRIGALYDAIDAAGFQIIPLPKRKEVMNDE